MITFLKKNLFVFFFLASPLYSTPHVLVSVAPHKFFVEQIANGTVTVDLMVPAGASAHTFEPTPKQMLASSKAEMWFTVGEAFEARAVRSFTSHNPSMKIIDLRQGVDMISADPLLGSCCCCHANGQDLHIWLSARQAKIQAATIASALSEKYPENAEQYQKSLQEFTAKLDALDNKLTDLLKPLQRRVIMVSHPAYAYFCRDYNLSQLSIEFEGKDPTPYQLTTILNKARSAGIQRVYVQPQYSSKGARLFAKELKAEVITLDPYAENFIQSMEEIGGQFAKN